MSDREDRWLESLKGRVERQQQKAATPHHVATVFRHSFEARFVEYVGDPLTFFESLIDPDTGELFVLYPAEKAFLRELLTKGPDGRLKYREAVFSAPKKSGKSTLNALVVIYIARVLAPASGRFAEGIICANDLDQAVGRVFRQAARIVGATPLLQADAEVLQDRIVWHDGVTVTAVAADWRGAAGANPSIVSFDELWGFTSEASQRLFDELIPSPTRPVSLRLVTSYAGFSGESALLEKLYRRAVAGEQIGEALYKHPGLLCFWSHACVAPWQTSEWVEEQRATLRPSAFARQIENRFTSGESSFLPPEWWAACEDPELRPVVADPNLPVWVGVDASVRRDSTAIVVVTYDREAKRVVLVDHRIFRPTPDDPIDFERSIEATLLQLITRFRVRTVRYDPYQMQATAQRLTARRVPMIEFAQTVGNLTDASSNLYELVRGRNLQVYADADLRLAVQRSVAVETTRGWRIAKEQVSHKIDIVVSLAAACLAAVEDAAGAVPLLFGYAGSFTLDHDRETRDEAVNDPGDALDQEALRRMGGVWLPGEPWPSIGDEAGA